MQHPLARSISGHHELLEESGNVPGNPVATNPALLGLRAAAAAANFLPYRHQLPGNPLGNHNPDFFGNNPMDKEFFRIKNQLDHELNSNNNKFGHSDAAADIQAGKNRDYNDVKGKVTFMTTKVA